MRSRILAVMAALFAFAMAAGPAQAGTTQIGRTGGTGVCAISDGQVYCWGSGSSGQMGNGTWSGSATPVATGLRNAQGTFENANGQCAIVGGTSTSGGQVYCWGEGTGGQLGNGTTLSSTKPVAVPGLSNALQVSPTGGGACALLADGKVRCWGDGTSGQLGNGTTTGSSTPVAVKNLPAASKLVSSAVNRMCAITTSGAVYCWGAGTSGQLGNGSTTDSSVAVAVTGLSGPAAQLSNPSANSTCARLNSGAVQCWGEGSRGQLGNGGWRGSSTPVTVTGITTAAELTGFSKGACARLSSGAVQCWGDGTSGQLGDGSTILRNTPTTVAGLSDAASLQGSSSNVCAVRSNGAVACWGSGSRGQLGNGGWRSSPKPAVVSGIGNATGINNSGDTFCVTRSGGKISCWGAGTSGQLGNGAWLDSPLPVIAKTGAAS